jgi:2-oxoglutarate/2-oxoacid ferredoxin oxidoreductase subunit beta
VQTVPLHDGGAIRIRRIEEDYDPTDKVAVMAYLEGRRLQGEVVTGLLYHDATDFEMHDGQNTVDAPLNALADRDLVPGSAALAKVNASLR